MLKILVTRTGAFQTLLKILSHERQSGAVKTLRSLSKRSETFIRYDEKKAVFRYDERLCKHLRNHHEKSLFVIVSEHLELTRLKVIDHIGSKVYFTKLSEMTYDERNMD